MGSLTAQTNSISTALPAPECRRRPRFLCLHGFRTSGAIMRAQVMGKWPDRVTSRLHLFFADALFPAEGKSDVEGIFDPPYYEWFQFDKKFMEYRNFDECLDYIEDLMIKHGPFDGLMGFSQARSDAVGGDRRDAGEGFGFEKGAKGEVRDHNRRGEVPLTGEMDFLKGPSEALLDVFANPTVVRHPKGHTVPRLDDKSLEKVLRYIESIEKDLDGELWVNAGEEA
ncbi:Rhodanese-like domain-containing protein 6 [Apostasia shenzhenica]|uniref:Rhodanese-like domain-containing protein 6 n=1 Tax=Apostasia shenzhenica TaxID=1088818 RepID=A0A2I0A3A9_9ASPA|nr:Rhodanese-like domain-containing protein 6 [Apostasia shenzhenica]